MREGHLMPLPDQALALLEELHTRMSGPQWLFPDCLIPKTRMPATEFNRALERMGISRKHRIGSSAHAFRATASTMFNGQGSRKDFIECQLALAERNKTQAATTRLNILTTGDSCCSIVLNSSMTFRGPRTTLHIRSFGGMTRSDIPMP